MCVRLRGLLPDLCWLDAAHQTLFVILKDDATKGSCHSITGVLVEPPRINKIKNNALAQIAYFCFHSHFYLKALYSLL